MSSRLGRCKETLAKLNEGSCRTFMYAGSSTAVLAEGNELELVEPLIFKDGSSATKTM